MKQFGLILFLILFAGLTSFAQSIDESFPTPVNAAEISGTIAARDIGDSRLTRHFYTFFAENGDLNLNIETANFDGDVDLFEAGTLRTIAKITVAASGAEAAKTSRIVYFRKREQVVLRVEGRTLVDEAARYKINFSGSFAAAAGLPAPPDDLTSKVERKPSENAVARVNSAGAIVEVLPPKKPAPKPVEETAAAVETPKPESTARTTRTPRTRRTAPANRRTVPPAPTETALEVSSETTAATEPKPVPAPRRTRPVRQPRPPRQPAATRRKTETPPAPQPDPLASVRLTIQLKNGAQIERPMSEIFRVSVDKGQLTVITKSGKIERYNLLEVAKFSIEQ